MCLLVSLYVWLFSCFVCLVLALDLICLIRFVGGFVLVIVYCVGLLDLLA